MKLLVTAILGLFSLTLAGILISQRAVTEEGIVTGMRSILVNASDGMIPRTEQFLVDAQEQADLTESLLSSNIIENNAELGKHFGARLASTPEVSGIFYGTADGEFLFVNRSDEVDPDGYRTKTISINEGVRSVQLDYSNSDFQVIESQTDPDDTYDPRQRPWFGAALQSDGPVFTDPYVFFSSQAPGVTASVAVLDADGQLAGVVGVDIELSQLSAFLSDLKLGDSGTAFIISGDGNVIALEELDRIKQADGDGFRLSTVQEVDDELVLATLTKLTSNVRAVEPQFFTVEHDHTTKHVFVAPIEKTNWFLGVALDEQDFLGAVRDVQRDNTIIAISISLVSIVGAWLLIQNVTGPLSYLRERAAEVETGALMMQEPANYRVTELQRTADAFDHMVRGLNEKDSLNKELLEDLEQRVDIAEDLAKDLRSRERTLESVLHSAEHQLSRELVLLGFAIDDLTDEGIDTKELLDSYGRLEPAKDMIAVLARLGHRETVLGLRKIMASELVPAVIDERQVTAISTDAVTGDFTLLKTLTTLIFKYAEQVGITGAFELETNRDSLRIRALDLNPDAIAEVMETIAEGGSDTQAQLYLIGEIVEAHGGRWTLEPHDDQLEFAVHFAGSDNDSFHESPDGLTVTPLDHGTRMTLPNLLPARNRS